MNINTNLLKASDFGTFEQDGEVYVQSFLLGMQAPFALDPITHQPRPFGFKDRESMMRVAQTAVGMPYLEKKGSKYHVAAATAEELYAKQKDFGWGEIVGLYENPNTGNVNAIWKPFPKYIEAARAGKLSPFTSPYIVNIRGTDDAIEDGQIAHLHGVPNSGYPPEIASIKSVCIGGLQQCMTEMKAVAAAAGQTFSNKQQTSNKGNMGEDANNLQNGNQSAVPNGQQAGLTLEGVNAEVQSLKQDVGGVQQTLTTISAKIDALGGAQKPEPPVAAAGEGGSAQGVQTQMVQNEPEDKVEQITKELNTIKEERKLEKESLEKEKSELALEKRKSIVKEIVEAKLKLHQLKLEDKDKEFKRLMELKNEGSEDLRDLSVLHEEITSQASSLAAAGSQYDQYQNYFGLPEISEDEGNSNKDYYSLSNRIGA